MVIILFKKASFSSQTQRNWQTALFCFFIVSTNKLKANCILFFTEIMDSFWPKREQLAHQKVRSIFCFHRFFVIAGDLFRAHCSYSCPFCPFSIIPKFCLSCVVFVQFFKYFALFKHIFALFVRNQTIPSLCWVDLAGHDNLL